MFKINFYSMLLMTLLGSCGVQTTNLKEYAAENLFVTLRPVSFANIDGPKVLEVFLTQRANVCPTLNADVSVTVGTSRLTVQESGGLVSRPKIGSGASLDNKECIPARFTLDLNDAAALEALDLNSALVVADSSQRYAFEVVKPATSRRLSRIGTGPVRAGGSFAFQWTPEAQMGVGSSLIVPDGGFRRVTPMATDAGAILVLPTDLPVGENTLNMSGFVPQTIRCEGIESCRFLIEIRNSAELKFNVNP